jgi:RNA polymerase sigma factor (sigma-70 family)
MLIWKNKKALFQETALPHLDAVYRFAHHLCGNDADAEDLTQECFHQAFRKFHQFQSGTNCRAWLFTIARNAYIDQLRRKGREPKTAELDDLPDPASLPGTTGGLERWHEVAIDGEEVFRDLFGDEVNRFLDELQREFRLAVVLCDVEGFSYAEIGAILGCPVGTVRSRISRARSFLREKLYQYAKGLGYVKCSKEK